MHTLTLTLSVAVGLSLAVARSARADDPRADRLIREGKTLFEGGKADEAYKRFRSAFAIEPRFTIAANLGVLELTVGKPRDAAEHLALALSTFPQDEKAEKRAELADFLDRAKREIGTLTLHLSPENATLEVDGAFQASASTTLFVSPGEHTLQAHYEGRTVSQLVDVEKGTTHEITLTLPRSDDTPAASVRLSSEPTLTRPSSLDNTTRRVPGHSPPSTATRVERKRGTLIVVGLVSSTALAGLGLSLTVASNAKANSAATIARGLSTSDADAFCAHPPRGYADDCGAFTATSSNRATLGDFAVASFVAAGAMAIGTGAYALWPVQRGSVAAKQARTPPRLQPFADRTGGGLSLVGRF